MEREGEGHIRRGEREYGFRNARRMTEVRGQPRPVEHRLARVWH